MKKNKEIIPQHTPYCHDNKLNPCPYWKWRNFHILDVIWVYKHLREKFELKEIYDIYEVKNKFQLFRKIYKAEHNLGCFVCNYLGVKDTYQGDTLLWDMCKECDEGDDYGEE